MDILSTTGPAGLRLEIGVDRLRPKIEVARRHLQHSPILHLSHSTTAILVTLGRSYTTRPPDLVRQVYALSM